MNTTKKKLAVLFIGVAMMLASAGCTSTTSSPSQESGVTQTEEKKESGKLGDYAIEIGDYSLTKTYEGKDAIVINMKFTNNTDDATSYMASLIGSAFQDGVELSTAIIMDSSAYDAESQMKDIKTGASIDVQVAYELSNTTSDVEFEVEEFISFNDSKIEKVFKITE